MNTKKRYIRPELEAFRVRSSSLLAGSQPPYGDAKPNIPEWSDEDDVSDEDINSWKPVGFRNDLEGVKASWGE